MATRLFTEKDNGDLKIVAEVDEDDVALALDELLDEYPRYAGEEFIAINDGAIVTVKADSDEIVQPRRSITVTGGSSNGNSAVVADEEEAEEEESAPAPVKRRTSSRRGKKRTAAKKAPAKKASAKKRAPAKKGAGRKTAAKKSSAKKGGNPLAKKGGSFRSNPRSAE
jgi:topoisomerase IA-like protein